MRACNRTCSLVPGCTVCLWNFCLLVCCQAFSLVWFGFKLAVLGLSYSTWDLVPWPWIEPGPPVSRAWCLNHRTTREVIAFRFNSLVFLGVKAPCGGGGGTPGDSGVGQWGQAAGLGCDVEVTLAKLAETCHQWQLPGHRGQNDARGGDVSPCGACWSCSPGNPSPPGLRRAWSGWGPVCTSWAAWHPDQHNCCSLQWLQSPQTWPAGQPRFAFAPAWSSDPCPWWGSPRKVSTISNSLMGGEEIWSLGPGSTQPVLVTGTCSLSLIFLHELGGPGPGVDHIWDPSPGAAKFSIASFSGTLGPSRLSHTTGVSFCLGETFVPFSMAKLSCLVLILWAYTTPRSSLWEHLCGGGMGHPSH